jgi:PiT family inorganic phosphate transporter
LRAFAGTAVAKTLSFGRVDTEVVAVTSQVLICALAGGIACGLLRLVEALGWA